MTEKKHCGNCRWFDPCVARLLKGVGRCMNPEIWRGQALQGMPPKQSNCWEEKKS